MPEYLPKEYERDYIALSPQYRKIMEKVASDENVLFIDFMKLWNPPEETFFQKDNLHLTIEGEKQFSQDVYDNISKLKILENSNF